jgi:TPR repeat protein
MNMKLLAAGLLCGLTVRAGGQSDFDPCLQSNVQAAQQLAARGDAPAEYCLGFYSATGKGVTKDVAEGVRHFRRAADKGYAPAEAFMGYFYKHGQGVEQDYAQAVQWYRKAADQGFASAQTDLALMYLDGLGVPKDETEARKWLRLSAAQGNGQAMNALAALDRGGPPKARQEPAMDEFEQGRKLYLAGDKAGAIRYFLPAAQAGNSLAEIQVGYQYENGEGVSQDYRQAAQWYARAANLGAPTADCNLGFLYEAGAGVAEDWVQASRLYQAGADLNNKRCQFLLGRAYEFGIGVAQNRASAIEWFTRAGAGAQGDPQAAYFARWLRDPTNNIGFRNQAEHDLVIGGRLRFGMGSDDPAGLQFHNSAERTAFLMRQRRDLDVREAQTMWGINKREYDDCQRNHGESCINPGPPPPRQ